MSEEMTSVDLMDDENFFDPAEFEDVTDGNHTEETQTEDVQQSEETGSETTETPAEAAENPETTEQAAETKPELFDLKFLGETKQYSREEMTALAQKGLNHDRILQQRDELQQFKTQNEESLFALDRIASMLEIKGANPKEVRDNLLRAMEKNARRQRGESEAEAEANIRAEAANRQLQTYQTQEQRMREQQMAAQQRQQRDIQEFVQKYPGLDPKTIPSSVWMDVRKGDTLVNAYGRYEMQQLKAENQRLQQQIDAKAQNDKNKNNSLGSMQSGAATPKIDPFLEGFDQG